jgi:hypothetical protein
VQFSITVFNYIPRLPTTSAVRGASRRGGVQPGCLRTGGSSLSEFDNGGHILTK